MGDAKGSSRWLLRRADSATMSRRTARCDGMSSRLDPSHNKWEEQYFLREVEDSEVEYGVDECDGSLDAAIRELCNQFGERAAAQNLGISQTASRRALKVGLAKVSRSIRSRLAHSQ
jgi:hypothetical protein